MSDRPRHRPPRSRSPKRPQGRPPVPGRDATTTGTYDGNARGSCFEKSWYPTEQIAKETAARISRERNIELRHYFCPDCGNWHLTKQPKRSAA